MEIDVNELLSEIADRVTYELDLSLNDKIILLNTVKPILAKLAPTSEGKAVLHKETSDPVDTGEQK